MHVSPVTAGSRRRAGTRALRSWNARRHAAASVAGDPHEGGFTVVEMLVGIGIFAIIAVGFAQTMATSLRVQVVSRQRTAAVQLATEQVERARALDYDQVGIIGGNPPGTLPAEQDVTVGRLTYHVAAAVGFVDDPIPGGFSTYANYKRLEIVVTSPSGLRLAHLSTVVAPPTQPSLNKAVVKVQVVDVGTNQPLPGVAVQLSGGPDGLRMATTGADGGATFASLTPNPVATPQTSYRLGATLGGYVVLADDLPPAPAAQQVLAAGQVFSTVLRMYKPATIVADLVDENGAPYTGAAEVTVSSKRGTGTVAATDGQATVTTLDGEPLVPGLDYVIGARTADGTRFASVVRATVPAGYPDTLVHHVTLALRPMATQPLQVHVRDSADQPISGAVVFAVGGDEDAIVVGTTNAGGIALLDVPAGTSAPYVVRAEAQLGYDAGQVTATLQADGTTVAPTLVLAQAAAP